MARDLMPPQVVAASARNDPEQRRLPQVAVIGDNPLTGSG